MSSVDKISSTCLDSKPRYVKKLNFGQRLGPNLKIHQPRSEIFSNNNAENSLNVDKESFVNDWLKKNEDNFFEEDNLIYPSSPVLSSSIVKRTPGSPIVGNRKKRPRRVLSLRKVASERGNSNLDVDHLKSQNASFISSCLSNQTEQSGSKVQRSQENIRQPLFLQSLSNANKSPVLIDKVRLRRLRQKRLSQGKSKAGSAKLDNSFKSDKNEKLEENVQISRISIFANTPDKTSNSKFEEKEIIQEEEIDDETFYEEETIEEEKIIEDKTEEEVIKENLIESLKLEVCEKNEFNHYKSSAKENSKIFRDNESTFIEEEDTETEDSMSIFIEDADTPDVISVNNIKKVPVILKEKIVVPCQSSSKDSDETFFSRPGSCESVYRQERSQKISEISSSKIKTDSLSQVINVISTQSVSPKPVVQSFVNILKTEKKKRKVKKGSLAAKVQTLVNREISFLRMWHHQISKPTFQNVNVQFVDLCIQRYYSSYSRQFTECHLIADTHNLLKNVINLQTDPSQDSHNINNKKSINRTITVMTVPEVVGELNAKRGKRLKVYPPWEILDQENVTLSVMYFTVDEKVNLKVNDEESLEIVKSKRVENFDCPCIQERKVVEDCSFRFSNKKPNVIQEIFNIS